MTEYEVPDMHCQHCVRAITDALRAADPRARIDVDLARKRVRVDTTAAADTVHDALTRAGYPPTAAPPLNR